LFRFLKEHRIYFVYTPLILYWIILLIATSLPAPDLPDVWGSDKLKHFLAYAVLALLLNLALLVQDKHSLSSKKAAFLTLGICFLYGLFDEIHQMFIPGRSAEGLDLAADITGALTGVLVVFFIIRRENFIKMDKLRNALFFMILCLS
jgi:VanZ family protein